MYYVLCTVNRKHTGAVVLRRRIGGSGLLNVAALGRSVGFCYAEVSTTWLCCNQISSMLRRWNRLKSFRRELDQYFVVGKRNRTELLSLKTSFWHEQWMNSRRTFRECDKNEQKNKSRSEIPIRSICAQLITGFIRQKGDTWLWTRPVALIYWEKSNFKLITY